MRKEFTTRSAGKFMAADGIDLQIDKGGMTALLGPSGSGGHASARNREAAESEGGFLSICSGCWGWQPILRQRPCCAGKTTLLRLIAGLEEPTAGRIFFDGAKLGPPMSAFTTCDAPLRSVRPRLLACHTQGTQRAMWAQACEFPDDP